MNHDDKLKEAAENYVLSLTDKWEMFGEILANISHDSFSAGAAYRDHEIKALLEIIKMQREALDLSTTSSCIGDHFVFKCKCARCKAITATDEKLKELGVEI